jgi:hypothetical protein
MSHYPITLNHWYCLISLKVRIHISSNNLRKPTAIEGHEGVASLPRSPRDGCFRPQYMVQPKTRLITTHTSFGMQVVVVSNHYQPGLAGPNPFTRSLIYYLNNQIVCGKVHVPAGTDSMIPHLKAIFIYYRSLKTQFQYFRDGREAFRGGTTP